MCVMQLLKISMYFTALSVHFILCILSLKELNLDYRIFFTIIQMIFLWG